MADRFKLAYIGAGSFRFSLGFYRNIVNATELLPMEVALCDIDPVSLELMTNIFKRMVKKAAAKKGYKESDIEVTASTDRRVVLENADCVYKSISVGMQESEWFDIYLPLKFGSLKTQGDRWVQAVYSAIYRTDPACFGIVKDMKELCSRAPLLNYTNPASCCTLAGRTAAPEVNFIGLCHELFGGMGVLKRFYNQKCNKHIKRWQKWIWTMWE